MIGALRGQASAGGAPGEVIVDVGGVGYRVQVLPQAIAGLTGGRAPVSLHVHTRVREDAITLYGFLTLEELRTFETLIGAHGVGPSLALALLAVMRPAELWRAVADGDAEALCAVPGIGRKTAARLAVELSQRLEAMEGAVTLAAAGAIVDASATAQVRAALAELGYGPEEIRRALAGVGDGGSDAERAGSGGTGSNGTDTGSLLRAALRNLAGAR